MKYIKLFESFKYVSSFPSEEFEKKTGIYGLSTEWKLPPKYDYDKLFNKLLSLK